MGKCSHILMLIGCFLLLGLTFACNRENITTPNVTNSETDKMISESMTDTDIKSSAPVEPEKRIYICYDRSEENVSEVRIIVWQEELSSPISDPENRYIWEGLMYEVEGSGKYYEWMSKVSEKSGKIWKRPENSLTDYPIWFLEPRPEYAESRGVTIYPAQKENTFHVQIGSMDWHEFVCQPSASNGSDPFYWDVKH